MSDSERSVWLRQIESASMQATPYCTEWMKRMHQPAVVDDGSSAAEPASMSDPPQSESGAPTSSDVQRHIDQVCDHLIAGRTTPAQRSGLSTAVERAGRVSSGSDAAVGRIARWGVLQRKGR